MSKKRLSTPNAYNMTQEELLHKRKPPGFWESLTNTLAVARAIIEKHDLKTLPSFNELHEMGYSSLPYAVFKHHESMDTFRMLLGEKPKRRKNHEHRSLDELILDLKKIIQEKKLKRLPRADILIKEGYSQIVKDIHYHGGVRKIRESLNENIKRVPMHSWKDLTFAINKAEGLMKENNWEELPGSETIKEIGGKSLVSAINKYHGGMRKFRSILGQSQKEVEKGSWKSIDYVIEQAQTIMQEHNFKELPGSKTLNDLGYKAFVGGIYNYHGGMRKFRQKLGQKQLLKEQGFWKSQRNTIIYANKVKETLGITKLPSTSQLHKRGYSNLASAITTYHGGMSSFRKILGEKQVRRSSKKIKDFNYILQEVLNVMEENNLERIPGAEYFNKNGMSYIINAINRHHGGMTHFKQKAGENQTKKPNGYWEDWNNYKKEFLRAMDDFNYVPKNKELYLKGYSSLVSYSKYHGGMIEVKKKLGFLEEDTSVEDLESLLTKYVGGEE